MNGLNTVVCCSKLLEGVFTFGKQYENHSSKNAPMYNLLSDDGRFVEVSSSYFEDAELFQHSMKPAMEEKDHRNLDISLLLNEEVFTM